MTDKTAKSDDMKRLRQAVNQDGLLDVFAGAALLLTLGLAILGWLVMDNPGVSVGIAPLLPALLFEPARKKYTYPRLGCPDYRPTQEIRFALIALTVSAALGVVVFLLTALAGIRLLRPLFEHGPVWAALIGSALLLLLAWWYRSKRFLGYIAVSAVAVVAGYLLDAHMPVRLAILAGAMGVAMTGAGTVLFLRFLRALPPAGSATALG